MLLTILLILVVFAVFGGGWGYSRWGYAGWSPLGLLLLIVLILYFTGNLHMPHWVR